MIKLEKTIQKMTILRADRSECNESEAQEMAGCLADGERVIAYFPSLSAMRKANLLASAPDLLQLAKDFVLLCELHDLEGAVLDSAKEAIANAERSFSL